MPDWAQWRDELFGLTFEPAVIVYNKAWFVGRHVPESRFDLIDLLREGDAFRGRVGTYDIETSGVGYLLAFLDAAQATTWGRLVESLGRNSAQLFCCTADILDRVADGRLLIGYNVLGSYAQARAASDDRVGIVLPSDYTLVLSRAAFVSRDAEPTRTCQQSFSISRSGRRDSRFFPDHRDCCRPRMDWSNCSRVASSAAPTPSLFAPCLSPPLCWSGSIGAKRQVLSCSNGGQRSLPSIRLSLTLQSRARLG